MTNSFPNALWGEFEVRFMPYDRYVVPENDALPTGAALYAVVLFAFDRDRCAVADIVGRGWCVPSGRLEAGENAEMAARREAYEEAGLTVGALVPLGHYRLTSRKDGTTRVAMVYQTAILAQGTLPPETESRGTRLVALDELPSLYYLWDPLIEAVCRYAFDRRHIVHSGA